jgi:hypothetical protein
MRRSILGFGEIGALLAMAGELPKLLPKPEPTPDGKPRIRRGYGTQRCANQDCTRTISANKAWCAAHADPQEVKG